MEKNKTVFKTESKFNIILMGDCDVCKKSSSQAKIKTLASKMKSFPQQLSSFKNMSSIHSFESPQQTSAMAPTENKSILLKQSRTKKVQ